MSKEVRLKHSLTKTTDKLINIVSELDKLNNTEFSRLKVIIYKEKLQELEEYILQANRSYIELSSIYLEDKKREENACNELY